MKNDLILVYDDRVQVSQTLKDIVSVDNYSDITKSRKKIYQIVLEEKIVNNFKHTIHLKSDDDLKLLDSIRDINDDYFYLVFPSSIENNSTSKINVDPPGIFGGAPCSP